jgi:cytidylate kinase
VSAFDFPEAAMAVITLSREMGSRGDDIARSVAARLGLRLVGRDLINRAAKEAGAPEVALAEIDELGLLGVKPSAAALRLYREKMAAVIRELAAEGNVLLVGRGGQVVLAGWPNVLHVRIIAPHALRLALVQARCRVSAEIAAARIDASDAARSGFLKRHFGVHGGEPHLYDLVISMAQIDVPAAVDLVCLAAARLGSSQPTSDQAAPPLDAEGCECR